MRKVSIRELRKNLSSELERLPFAVTKNNKVIANVYTSVEKVTEKVIKEKIVKSIKLCVHGNVPTLCKHSKCRGT